MLYVLHDFNTNCVSMDVRNHSNRSILMESLLVEEDMPSDVVIL